MLEAYLHVYTIMLGWNMQGPTPIHTHTTQAILQTGNPQPQDDDRYKPEPTA